MATAKEADEAGWNALATMFQYGEESPEYLAAAKKRDQLMAGLSPIETIYLGYMISRDVKVNYPPIVLGLMAVNGAINRIEERKRVTEHGDKRF